MNKGTRDLGSYLLDSGNEETCWGWDWASFPSCSYLKGRRTLWAPVIIVWNLFWQLRLQDLQYSIPKTFLAMISHSEMDRPMHRLCSSMLAWAPAAEILGGPGVQKPASHLSALAQTCQTNCDSIHCAHAHLLSTGYSQSNPNATEQVRAITRAPGPGGQWGLNHAQVALTSSEPCLAWGFVHQEERATLRGVVTKPWPRGVIF